MSPCTCTTSTCDCAAPALPSLEISTEALWSTSEAWGPILGDGPAPSQSDFRSNPPPWVAMAGARGPRGPAGSLAAIIVSVSMTWGLSTLPNDDVDSHGQLLTIGTAYPP